MPETYLVAYLKVTGNLEEFKTEYAAKVPKTLEPFDGRYLAKALPLSNAKFSEGTTAKDYTLCAVLVFPSKEKAMAWKSSAAYQAILPARKANTQGPVAIVEGLGNESKLSGKVKAILVAFLNVSDMDTFKQYAGKVPSTLEPVNGQYLVKALPLDKTALYAEGSEGFTLAAILGFESIEKAMEWHDSKLYHEDTLPLRLKSATGPMCITATL